METTFGAVHLRSVGIDRVRELVVDAVREEGFVAVEPDDPSAGDGLRRVLLVDDADWVALADEDAELDPGLVEDWAQRLSADLGVVALGIWVRDSESATLWLYDHGRLEGLVSIPGEGSTPDDHGHCIDVRFLARLAVDERAAGILMSRIDWTHEPAERIALRLAEAVGIRYGSLGAEDWEDPPPRATRLGFRDAEAASRARTAPRLLVAGPADPVEGVEGYPLDPHGLLYVTLEGGTDPIEGVEIEVWGRGAALLRWSGLAGWIPRDGDPEPPTWLAVPEIVDAEPPRIRFRFPQVRLTPAVPIDDDDASWGFEGEGTAPPRLVAVLHATARMAGEASMYARASVAGGILQSDALELDLRIARAPRRGVCPSTAPVTPDLDEARALQDYAGRNWAFFWAALAADWTAVEPLALRLGDLLVGELFAVTRAHRLQPRVVSGGRYPAIDAHLQPGGSLTDRAWAPVRRLLAVEAAVTLGRPGEHGSASSVVLRHEPRGHTLVGRGYGEPVQPCHARVPVQIGACFPRPRRRADEARMSSVLDEAVKRVAADPRCVGAMVGATGRPLDPADDDHPYETVCGLRGGHAHVAWLEGHVRGPGWRVLVPRRAARRIGQLPPCITVHPTAAGTLLAVDVSSPFVLRGAVLEAIERSVLDVVGSWAEILALPTPGTDDA